MRARFVWIFALIAIALLVGCRSDEAQLAEHFDRGEKYREEKKHSEAIIEYKNALQIDPNHAGAHYGLARSYLESGAIKRRLLGAARDGAARPVEPRGGRPRSPSSRSTRASSKRRSSAPMRCSAENPNDEKAYLVKGQAHEATEAARRGAGRPSRRPWRSAPEERGRAARVRELLPSQRRPQDCRAALRARGRDTADRPGRCSRSAAFLRRGPRARRRGGGGVPQGARDREARRRGPRLSRRSASFLFARDRVDDAEAMLEQGIAAEPRTLELIYLLARFYHVAGRHGRRRDELIERATTAAKPDDPRRSCCSRATAARMGDLQGALAAAEKARRGRARRPPVAKLRKAEVLVDIGFRDNDDGEDRSRAARSSTRCSPRSRRSRRRCSSRRRSTSREASSTRRSRRCARRSTRGRTGRRRTTCSARRCAIGRPAPARAASSCARSRSTRR